MPPTRSRATIAGVVAVASVVASCGAPPASQPAPATVPAASASPSTPTAVSAAPSADTPIDIEAAGATRIELAGAPDWVATAAGSAWVAVDGGVRRVDGTTGAPDGLIVVPGVICLGFDIGFDSLWAGSCDRHLLVRIDPSTGSLDTPFIDLPVAGLQEEGSIGVGDSGVWLVSSGHELLHLDPVTNGVDGRWPLPAGAAAVRAGLDSVWVTVSDTDALLKIDPADPRTSQTITVGDGPRFLALGEASVWVMNQADGTVSRVDASGSVVATIEVSDVPIRGGDIAVGGGFVWVRTEGDLVVTVDPRTNAIERRFGPPSGSGSVAVDDTAAWVTAHDTASLWRLPLR